MTLYRWQATITDEFGNVMPGAQVTVRSEASGLLPSLFADKAGTEPLGNPFTIDTEGNGAAAFYVAAGFYEITATLGTLIAEAQDANVGAMNVAVYDPGGVEADGFDSTNIRYDNTASGLTATTVQGAVDEVKALVTFTGALPVLASGAALPTSNIGPIWHADYASIMTWRAFTDLGAAYTGYASADIGDLVLLGTFSARAGTVKMNGASLSKTQYAALWNWAVASGLSLATGTWVAGTFRFGDNADGTFRLPDLRGEFLRGADDSRGIDSGRTTGTWQDHQLQDHDHNAAKTTTPGLGFGDGGATSISNTNSGPPTTGNHGAETRPRNVAVLYAIKF